MAERETLKGHEAEYNEKKNGNLKGDILIALGLIGAFLILLAAGILIFWIWMLVDCLKRDDDNFAIGGKYAKLIWVVVIVFAHFIGALLYFFLVKDKGKAHS